MVKVCVWRWFVVRCGGREKLSGQSARSKVQVLQLFREDLARLFTQRTDALANFWSFTRSRFEATLVGRSASVVCAVYFTTL